MTGIKTFIYGVPHGFDIYENVDNELKDYFTGFYISSRRGRRLIINRRRNGETIYSYLRYGLREDERQAQHSFFGMSIITDENQFSPDFKVMLEWFDYLFDRFVNEYNVLIKNQDGIYRYATSKFSQNPEAINWLKYNLPNILTKSTNIRIVNYDSSFEVGKAGQVASLSDKDIDDEKLLSFFKKYCWLSIDSEVNAKPGPGSVVIDELDFAHQYSDLKEKLNEYNKVLLPIAIKPSQAHKKGLTAMSNVVEEILSKITGSLSKISDGNLRPKFELLRKEYSSLHRQIGDILKRLTPQPPKQQFCNECKQYKSPSEFRSPSASQCLECERQEKYYKTCVVCGQKKPIINFRVPGRDICEECRKSEVKPIDFNDIVKKIKDFVKSKRVALLLALCGIILGIAFVVHKCSGVQDPKPEPGPDPIHADVISPEELNSLLKTKDFNGVYDYIKDKKDIEKYSEQIQDALEKSLLTAINKEAYDQIENIADNFYKQNKELLSLIGSEKFKSELNKIGNDYSELRHIVNIALNNETITEANHKRGVDIIAQHQGVNIFEEERERLDRHYKNKNESQKQVNKREESVQTDKNKQGGGNNGRSNSGAGGKDGHATKKDDSSVNRADSKKEPRYFDGERTIPTN